MARRPNILLIMTDQQKATAIRMYGNPDVPTPALERLAARGIRFDQCYTPHPLCVPARVSFWTGRYPHENGSRTNEIPMPPDTNHFARILKQAGYTLGLVGKNHCFESDDLALFDYQYVFSHQGPDDPENEQIAEVVRWIRGTGRPAPAADARPAPGGARVNPYPAEHCPTAVMERKTVEFLEQQAGQAAPFCAWISIPDPHGPLQCPEPYASMHPPESITLPPWLEGDLDGKMERIRVFRELLGYGDMTEAQIRQRVSIYYGMIRFIDDAIGGIMSALDRLGMAEDTIVAFCSDHGDYSGEHRLTDKSSTFLESMVRVPLLISWPGHLPSGTVDLSLVSLLDIIPTCLNLADVAYPTGIDGRVLPSCGGQPRDAVFSEYGAGGPRLHLADLPRLSQNRWQTDTPRIPLLRWREAEGHPKMVRMGQYKYVFDPMDEVDELYDLAADPWEHHNRAADPAMAEVRQRLRDRLLVWSLQTEGPAPAPLYFDQTTGLNMTSSFVLDR
jgi:choline-sulfatase